ncbi:hypothetical protein LJC59_09885, partial [Desulfovibrio sp. OttesenSCG-928-A18]|nr:hypothetical protein [Desulfovibrio sp. OttesenSCG-928-A18]
AGWPVFLIASVSLGAACLCFCLVRRRNERKRLLFQFRKAAEGDLCQREIDHLMAILFKLVQRDPGAVGKGPEFAVACLDFYEESGEGAAYDAVRGDSAREQANAVMAEFARSVGLFAVSEKKSFFRPGVISEKERCDILAHAFMALRRLALLYEGLQAHVDTLFPPLSHVRARREYALSYIEVGRMLGVGREIVALRLRRKGLLHPAKADRAVGVKKA